MTSADIWPVYQMYMIYFNETPLAVTMFSDGTSQVWKLPAALLRPGATGVEIRWSFEHEGEFLHLAQVKALLDSLGIVAHLLIDYLPYGRQDKACANDATFALLPFARLLNTLGFATVEIVDPHSPAALQLIDRSKAVYPVERVTQLKKDLNADTICYPDHGALTKYGDKQRPVYPYFDVAYGEKLRNQATGVIESYRLLGRNVKGNSVLIVDNICDGGMTFRLLARELHAAGARAVHLFVTHGIFSRGLKPLRDAGIKSIHTKNGEAFDAAFQRGKGA